MAVGQPQYFQNITPAQFASLEQQVSAKGIKISGNVGKASKLGTHISWEYDPAQLLLRITVDESGFEKLADLNQELASFVKATAA